MDLNKLPDNEMKPLNIETVVVTQKRTYGLLIAGLMLLNIIFFLIFSTEEGDLSHKIYIGSKTIVFGSIVLGFGLGLITALIPYKNFHYSEKYFRASLLNIIVIQIVLFATQIFFSMYE